MFFNDSFVSKICESGDVKKMEKLLEIQKQVIEHTFKTMSTIHDLYKDSWVQINARKVSKRLN